MNLKHLDLSCNPEIKLQGLCGLLCEATSNLHNLEKLELYDCGIEAPLNMNETCLDTSFIELSSLRSLNLSHNDLTGILEYISGPYNLIDGQLEELLLVNV